MFKYERMKRYEEVRRKELLNEEYGHVTSNTNKLINSALQDQQNKTKEYLGEMISVAPVLSPTGEIFKISMRHLQAVGRGIGKTQITPNIVDYINSNTTIIEEHILSYLNKKVSACNKRNSLEDMSQDFSLGKKFSNERFVQSLVNLHNSNKITLRFYNWAKLSEEDLSNVSNMDWRFVYALPRKYKIL